MSEIRTCLTCGSQMARWDPKRVYPESTDDECWRCLNCDATKPLSWKGGPPPATSPAAPAASVCDCTICNGVGLTGPDGETCPCIIAGCAKQHTRDGYLKRVPAAAPAAENPALPLLREVHALLTNIDHGPESLWHAWLFRRDAIINRMKKEFPNACVESKASGS